MAFYREDIVDIELESSTVFRSFLNNTIGAGDIQANRFGVRTFRNGVPENISGACAGYFIRADGTTVVINNGTVSGNVAYVELPESCYAVEGQFTLAIKCAAEGAVGTMRIVDGVVSRTSTDTTVDPGTLIPSIDDLIAAIEEAVESIPADYSDFYNSFEKAVISQSLASGTDLNTIRDIGQYRLLSSGTYTNQPVSGGRRLLIVSGNQLNDGGVVYQILIQCDTRNIYTRAYHDNAWDDWASLDTTTQGLLTAIQNQAIADDADLDSMRDIGFYRLSAGTDYANQPVSGGRRLLIVSASTMTGGRNGTFQILIQFNTGLIYTRMRHDNTWDAWKAAGDEMSKKLTFGTNPYRKALDHGGFYNTPFGNKQIYQNSPLSFITSAKEGIMFHNVDIVFSSDGVPMLSHGITVTDASGITRNLNNMTEAEIKACTFGDSDYSFTMQTLAEGNELIKSMGGIIDMVDISSGNNDTQKAHTGNLPAYYRANHLNPTYTNTDHDSHRDLFMQNGPEFGVYFVCNSAASIQTAISYVQNNPDHKFCMNIGWSSSTMREAMQPYMATALALGCAMYAYTYNLSNYNNVPGWADGVISENCNVNYQQALSNNII